jgi:hypothetical protein
VRLPEQDPNIIERELPKWVIEQGKLGGCDQVHLDSGPQRHDAHRLYLNHGMKIIGYHFALNLQS